MLQTKDIEKERQALYLKAYKDQEFQHAWRRNLGRTVAVIAMFIPPISLVFTIPSAREAKAPLWGRILACSVVAIVPFLSGAISWTLVTAAEKRRRENDTIYKNFRKRYAWIAADSTKEGRARFKETYPTIDWALLKKEKKAIKIGKEEEERVVEKPKKVKIINDKGKEDIYMDSGQMTRQYARARAIEFDKLTTDFFKESYQKSAAIVDQWENKYRKGGR